MEPQITNVSLLFTKQSKSFKLGNPKEILNSEGSLLILYMELDGGHYDLYLYAACADYPDYIYIKVNQGVLLSYLRNEVALQEVLFSCPKSIFYYERKKESGSLIIEIPISMLSNYRIAYSENMIADLPDGLVSDNLIQIIEYFKDLINRDPYAEEKWVELSEDLKEISVDASLYLRYII